MSEQETLGKEKREGVDPAYVEKLETKLREHARELQALEAYKCLCERRILQLAPQHDLPVTEQHFGTERVAKSPSEKRIELTTR